MVTLSCRACKQDSLGMENFVLDDNQFLSLFSVNIVYIVKVTRVAKTSVPRFPPLFAQKPPEPAIGLYWAVGST